MIANYFFCHDCGLGSYGEIVDRTLFLQLHCIHCGAFIRRCRIDECVNFRMYNQKYYGYKVSEIAKTKMGRDYLEYLLDNTNFLKDWQKFVIDKYIS